MGCTSSDPAGHAAVTPQDNVQCNDRLENQALEDKIVQQCPPGWLEAAQAYCACRERGDEWGTNPEDVAYGEEFDRVRQAFETLDLNGDRRISRDELAKALKIVGK